MKTIFHHETQEYITVIEKEDLLDLVNILTEPILYRHEGGTLLTKDPEKYLELREFIKTLQEQ